MVPMVPMVPMISALVCSTRIHSTQGKKGSGRRLERENVPPIRLQGSRVGGIVMPGLKELHAAGREGRILLEQVGHEQACWWSVV